MVQTATTEFRESRDKLAYVAAIAFAVSMYASIVNVFPALEALRPALLTAGLAAGLLAFARFARREPFTFDGGRGVVLIALSVWGALSILWSYSPADSRREAFELVKLTAIYLTLINLVNTPRRFTIMIIAAVAASLVPSWNAFDRWLNGVELLEGYRARWLGVYFDPNHMAMAFVAIVPAATTLVLGARRLLWRAVGLVGAALAIAGVVLSHSRGGLLGLIVAMGMWALSGKQKVRALVLAAIAGIGIGLFAPSSFWTRTQTIAEYERDLSAQGRVWAWEVGAAINRDRPLTGVGVGAFSDAWPHYAPPEARGAAFVAHNVFLSVLGELGWVGFFLLLTFLGMVFSAGVSAWKDPEVGPLARAMTAGFAGYLVCDLMSGYVLSSHFFFMAAMVAAARIAAQAKPAAAAAGKPQAGLPGPGTKPTPAELPNAAASA